jgi:hypothetical protein
MTLKKVFIKDTIFVLSVFTIAFISYWLSFSVTQIILGLIAVLVIGGILSFVGFVHVKFFQWLSYTWKHKIKLFIYLKKLLVNNYDTRMLDTIFTYFVHYYEINASEIETTRELPIESFPEGRFELAKVYRYIKEIRKHNADLLNRLDYDNNRNCPVYYDMRFSSIKFRVKNYMLQIDGVSDIEIFTYLQFSSLRTKINNALYDLDTEVANWVVKNRNHFGF